MCHHREWKTASESLDADEDEENSEVDPGLPSFLNEQEIEDDHEILTDGGDEP
jgi:hypothetical protein